MTYEEMLLQGMQLSKKERAKLCQTIVDSLRECADEASLSPIWFETFDERLAAVISAQE